MVASAEVMQRPRRSRWRRVAADLARLTRIHRPIGIWLLLWPTLWALWIAGAGIPGWPGLPSWRLLVIFVAGTVLMRSAGCVINDLADRNIDPHVRRTRDRPLAARRLSPWQALVLFGVLVALALGLVLMLNRVTVRLAFIGAGLTISYPLFKRFFPLPQLYLGLAFGWAVPMAFAATLGHVPRVGWVLLLAAVLWAGVYDTIYAMVDRDDDLRIGVQSSAILFGDMDLIMIGAMQCMVLFALWLVGRSLQFGLPWQIGLAVGAVLFVAQLWQIRHRDRNACMRAFNANQYFGLAIFVGLALQLWH
jgi:4-hydroxybenzoate polyprenyltransferase